MPLSPIAAAVSSYPPALVTLTTDFGLGDSYVAEMKGRLLALCPRLRIVDLTHDVPPFDVEAGAVLLTRTVAAFPSGTIHLAVIDPGVGTTRRGLVVRTQAAWFVGPDNGLFGPFLEGAAAFALLPERLSPHGAAATFHGRDLFAPAAARLALGMAVEDFAAPIADPVRPPVRAGGRIVHIDRFGNCITNLTWPDGAPAQGDSPPFALRCGVVTISRLVRTYGDAPPGVPVALVGSAGWLEIAVREGNAAQRLGLHRGDPVMVALDGGART